MLNNAYVKDKEARKPIPQCMCSNATTPSMIQVGFAQSAALWVVAPSVEEL